MWTQSEISRRTPRLRKLSQCGVIGQPAVDRGRVEFEVAGVDDQARRGVDPEADGIRNRVADAERLDREIAGLDFRMRCPDRTRADRPCDLSLASSSLTRDQTERQFGCVNRSGAMSGDQVGQRADMILMPVGDEDGADLVPARAQIADVGQDEVDAELLFLREADAAIDDDDVVFVFEQEHVLADLGETAEEDQFQLDSRCWLVLLAETRRIGRRLKHFHLRRRRFRGFGLFGLARPRAFNFGEEFGQTREILFDRAAQGALMERGGWVVHRHDQTVAVFFRLTVDL